MEPVSNSPALREQLRKATLYGGLVLAAVALVVASKIIPYIDDDAYVTFRFADNIASGVGLRFNRFLPPQEASASSLWTLLLVPVAKALGAAKLPSVAMLLGILCFVGSLALMLRLGRVRDEKTLVAGLVGRVLPAALWGLSAGAIFAAVTGTGTMLFVLLVLLVHGAIAGVLPGWAGVIAGLLAPWAAPEGGWVLVAVVLQFLVDGKDRGRRLAAVAGVVLVSAAVLAVARHRAFESWGPTWFGTTHRSLGVVLRSLVVNLDSSGEVLCLLAIGLFGASFGERRHRGYLAAALGWLVVVILLGCAPAETALQLQPVIALSALAAGGFAQGAPEERSDALRGVAVLAILTVMLSSLGILFRLRTLAVKDLPLREEQWDVNDWLKTIPVSFVATAEAGVFGYSLPGVDFVDFKGQVGPRDLEYLFLLRSPQLLMIRLRLTPLRDPGGKLEIPPALTASPEERHLLEDPRFKDHYVFQFVAKPESGEGYARAVYRSVAFPESLVRHPPGEVVDLPRAQ